MEDYLLRVAEYKVYVWVLLGVFLFALLLQLYFYFRYYSGIFRFKNRIDKNDVRLSTNKPAVSVIICARNESENLARFLPAVLKQKYPKFEVIVVNDGSTDESTDLLKKMTEKYPNLYQTFLPMGAKYMSRKKMCVTVGIKAAHYDHLLLVDADCEPASDQWIANIMRHYASGTSVVLGYTGYKGDKGFLDNMIAYDMMFEAMRFMGFALQRKPYRGVSGNLSYTKDLFFAKKGFTSHLILSYGDDDLLIRDIATKENTAVSVEPEAVTWSHRDLDMKSFLFQREKQMETYAEYLPSTKFRISSEIIWVTDEKTKGYFVTHGRPEAYKKLDPADVAYYDGCVYVDLSTIESTIAMPMHPSNTYTIHELLENPQDILHEVEEAANKQLKGVKMDLMSKYHDGGIWVEQGEIAGCSGGTFDNICAAADILRGKSCGNGAFSLNIYPGSLPAMAALVNNGRAFDLISAGAIMRECFCGP